MSDTSKAVRLRRLKFRAWRRGFVEADLLLGPFVDQKGADLSEAELDDFETLLEESDHDIFGWIIGREPPPARLDTGVLRRLQDFRNEVYKVARTGA